MMSCSLRVTASSIIKPAKPTPKHRLWLSDIDLIRALIHVPVIYIYRPTKTPTTTPFFSPQILKTSLSHALVHFYPLAGQLSHDPSGRLQILCNEAGVLFCEAESDAEISDLGDFRPTPELQALVPSVDYTTQPNASPLLLVQLTVFRCGGLSLGIAFKKNVIDGTSSAHFVSAWAKIARTGESGEVDVEPFFDRTVLRPRGPPAGPSFDHEEFKPPPQLVGLGDGEEERKKESTVEMFRFTSQQVDAIKEAAVVGRDGEKISRFRSVAAHLWRCTCIARQLNPDQRTKLYMPTNGRRRFRPPLPDGFFGNAVFLAALTARSGNLVSREMGHTARLIGEATVKMTSDVYMRSALEFLHGQTDSNHPSCGAHMLELAHDLGYFQGSPNMWITSWLGLPFCEADFGWGPPVHMGPAIVRLEGKAFIVPTVDQDGGLIVAVRLRPQHMEALKKLLYDAGAGGVLSKL